MDTVLEEITSEDIDAHHIERRVDDWEERLKSLFELIGDWLPDDWESTNGRPVAMQEELMRKFGVPTRKIPSLEIRDQVGNVVRFVPHALWIIGANGRIDMEGKNFRYYIIDTAENFERPNWEIIRPERRCERDKLSSEWLRSTLR